MRGNHRVGPVEIRDGTTSRLVEQDYAQEATMNRQPAAGAKLLELIHEMTGPRHGPVTPIQTHEDAQTASVNGYDLLILAGFSVDPEAQAFIQKAPIKSLRVHFANVNPDVLLGDPLKTSRASQLFTLRLHAVLHIRNVSCPRGEGAKLFLMKSGHSF
jgi:hypothetical protein